MADRIIRWKEAAQILSVRERTIYNWVLRGEFPEPLHIGKKGRGWRESVFDEAIDNLHKKYSERVSQSRG